ncbi:MAG: dihydropyrimidinase [Methylobacteriaceae bacterium]|nr:dihydropyrimidinase [Methylobacteriaceae bacterium]
MAVDLVVANGTVVTPQGAATADVLIGDGRILDIVAPGAGRGAQTVEARDRVVLPGGIDPHVHFLMNFMGQRSVYDFFSGSVAALRGGVTTFIDFALQRQGRSIADGLAFRRSKADGEVACDYGLHPIVTDVNDASLAEIDGLVAGGASTFKVYTIYRSEKLMLEDGPLLELMHAAGRAGGGVILHAENASIIDTAIARALARGDVAPRFHAATRPTISETEAVQRAILFGAQADCPIHIFHLNSGPAVALVAAARARGQSVSAETCTHYLALTDEVYDRVDGHLFVASPPLRDKANQDMIWAGLAEGALAIVTSDDASYSAEAKALGKARFDTIANGMPGVEARLPLLWTLGVASGRLTLERFCEAWAGETAKLFGLAPQKGAIAPGADADLVVIDPQTRRSMTVDSHFGPIGYNPFAGMELTGWPVATIRRGAIAVVDGVFRGARGEGRYLARKPVG